ncbi:MAG: hypothetical protein DWQ07_12315 [Chloroflexi bacterium]|nr:MAG: hypothetical protein DWQ07_12315 [Chloroflexota bacterium]
MNRRLQEELRLLRIRFSELEQAPEGEWFIVRWPLRTGWNKDEVRVLVQIPVGYPTSPPDNFYTDLDLRLANGQMPSNTSPNQVIAGQQWLQFSYHLEANTWLPHADVSKGHNLLSFLDGVGQRLNEAN